LLPDGLIGLIGFYGLPLMHTALIESLLEYEVGSPAHFLFNIETAFHDGHHVVEERLTITPSMKVRNFCDERSGNRFIRLDAPRGVLSVNYRARVELHPAAVPLHLDETPVTGVPDDVLRYLMPSRYCESDVMSRAAQQLFGQLQPGIRPRPRDRELDTRVHQLPARLQRLHDHGAGGVCAARGCVPRLRAPGHHHVPRAQHPGAAGGRLCALRGTAAGFSRGVRGLAGRALGDFRRDAHGAHRPVGARGHRARRQGRGLCHHLWRRAA
jgi:hypothetical protein